MLDTYSKRDYNNSDKITVTIMTDIRSDYYPLRLCQLARIDSSSPSVCLFVCPHHNSKMNDPKVFKLSIGYPRSDMVLGLKGQS